MWPKGRYLWKSSYADFLPEIDPDPISGQLNFLKARVESVRASKIQLSRTEDSDW